MPNHRRLLAGICIILLFFSCAEARSDDQADANARQSSYSGPNLWGPPIPMFSYSGRFSPENDTAPLTESKMILSAPVYRSPDSLVALSLTGGNVHLGEPVILDSGTAVPQDLYRVEFGAQYFRPLGDGKGLGFRASIGYADDQPFQNTRDLTYSFSANYGFPGSGKGYWVLMVFVSNNSTLVNFVPIPGVLYIDKAENFRGVFGFPIDSVQWTPEDPWTLSVSLFVPNFISEISYGHLDAFQLFSGFSWMQQQYLLADRVNIKDRLRISEMKGSAGFRFPIVHAVLGEIQSGWSFNRSIYIGDGLFNKEGGSTSLASDAFVSWGVRAIF